MGTMQALKRLGTSQATMVVRVVQATDGNMTKQLQVLKEVADNIGDCINKGYLPQCLVWQTLQMMVYPSISYPLVATMFSEDESTEITKKLFAQLLPSGSANWHYPKPFCHAPSAFFGLAFPQVVNTQFTEQVKWVLVHGALLTHTGQFFCVSLEQAQLEVYIGTPILESSYDDYGCLLTFCWIKVLWECLWIHKVTLCNPDQILPKLQQEGDFFFMEHLVELQVLSDKDLLHFNCCHLAYKAMMAANILTGDGVTVMERLSGPSPLVMPF